MRCTTVCSTASFYGACCKWRRAGRRGAPTADRHDAHRSGRLAVHHRMGVLAWSTKMMEVKSPAEPAPAGARWRWTQLPPGTPVPSRHAMACSWALLPALSDASLNLILMGGGETRAGAEWTAVTESKSKREWSGRRPAGAGTYYTGF
jgi:hypothetical protein